MSQHYNIALGVYKDFLKGIVKRHVFSDAERILASGVLSDEARKGIAADKREDIRPPYLCTISGKGGWSSDPESRGKYSAFTNVSLLDHLNSVVRGSLMFGALDLLAGGIAPDDVRRRLYMVAAIAFSHDLDKVIGKARNEDLSVADVDMFMKRFGIGDFLLAGGIQCDPDLFLSLISQVEDSRAGILPKGASLTSDWRNGRKDAVYVSMADKMDSMFLNKDKSVEDVLEVLVSTEDLKSDALRAGWRKISWDDPNIAFLLDHLQLEISNACQRHWGSPPLIEVHHDGRLLCVVPESLGDKIVETAVGKLASVLGGDMRIDVNARGSIDILDARGDIGDLRSTVQMMPEKTRAKILQVRVGWAQEHRAEILDFLHPTGYGPRLPDLGSFSGKLVPLWTGDLREDGIREFHEEACLATVLLCCVEGSPKLGIPNGDVRESELLDLLREHDKLAIVPDWLVTSDAKDRRPLLAALAVAHAMLDDVLRDALTGEGGLLETWLTGSVDRKGLVEKIQSTADKLNSSIRDHIGRLMRREVVMADDEAAEGRCHFTNMPISRDAKIDLKSGLYALNVSAFSGRSGRPEFFNRIDAETLVSPIALAEHKLRQIKFAASSVKSSLAMNISSPATSGLFGALAMDGEPINMRLVDMMRADKSDPSKMTFSNSNGVSRRILISRFEAFPATMVGDSKKMGQIGFVRGILEMALRLGRPVHVFRGLPRPTREFVWFDTLPEAIELAIGGRGLRLEQLPPAIRLLRGIEAISEQTGFGLDIALSVADPATRFGAACMAYSKAASVSEADFKVSAIKRFASNILEETGPMSEQDKSISRFAEAMAKYQKAPKRDDGANVYERGFRIALEQAEVLSANGMASDEHLKAGIAGLIKAEYDRAGLIVARDSVLEEAVRIFVEEVWTKAFKRQAPDSRIRRSAFAIYRWTFTQAAFAKFNQPSSN